MRPTLLEVVGIDHQQFVTADRRQEDPVAGPRPALKMRHLVDRKLLFAAAVIVQDAPHRRAFAHRVDMGQAVLTEQPGDSSAGRRR